MNINKETAKLARTIWVMIAVVSSMAFAVEQDTIVCHLSGDLVYSFPADPHFQVTLTPLPSFSGGGTFNFMLISGKYQTGLITTIKAGWFGKVNASALGSGYSITLDPTKNPMMPAELWNNITGSYPMLFGDTLRDSCSWGKRIDIYFIAKKVTVGVVKEVKKLSTPKITDRSREKIFYDLSGRKITTVTKRTGLIVTKNQILPMGLLGRR